MTHSTTEKAMLAIAIAETSLIVANHIATSDGPNGFTTILAIIGASAVAYLVELVVSESK